MSGDQPRLAGNDRCGGLTTGCSSVATTINMPAALEQFRTSQQTCQPTSVFRHHVAHELRTLLAVAITSHSRESSVPVTSPQCATAATDHRRSVSDLSRRRAGGR
jgi:hypothetical protein